MKKIIFRLESLITRINIILSRSMDDKSSRQQFDELIDIRRELAELEKLEHSIAKLESFKKINLAVSILPTVVAVFLVFYVFNLTYESSKQKSILQDNANVREQIIEKLELLNEESSYLSNIDSIGRDTTLYSLLKRKEYFEGRYDYDNGDAVRILIQEYIKSKSKKEKLQGEIDDLKRKLRDTEAFISKMESTAEDNGVK